MATFQQPSLPHDANPAPGSAYRSVCPAALVAFVLGLLSPLALAGPVLWFLPAAGVLAAASALRSIGQPGAMLSGSGLARFGLLSCLCFGVAGPVDMGYFRWLVVRESERFAGSFFQDLAAGQPQNAVQLRHIESRRRSPGDNLWAVLRGDAKARRELTNFVDEPLIKTLLLLGERAHARRYETLAIEESGARVSLAQIYAITFDDAGQRTTFFVNLALERTAEVGRPPFWRIETLNGPVRPSRWEP